MTFKSKLIAVLIFALISSICHSECQPTTRSAPEQQRQIGQHRATSTNSSSADRIAAILAAKPRPVAAGNLQISANSQQQQQQRAEDLLRLDRRNEAVATATSSATKLHSGASSVSKQKSVPLNPTSVSALSKAKSQVGKRQVDFADQNRPSRRNEDAWFLDQAPLPLQPYRFNYNVRDKNGLTEQYRQETGDGKFLTGSYGYVLPDGIFRHVDYVADDRGFRAFIRTSEPGTANQNPADVVINSSPVPGVGYATNPTSSIGGLQSPLGLEPKSQLNWSDKRGSWNYSTLGAANQFAPLNERFRSQFDGTLARRAPGSIVGTPLRNFSSLAYPLAPIGSSASLDLSTPPPQPASLWASSQPQDPPAINFGGNFQSLARFGDLVRLQPIVSNNLTSLSTGLGGGEQFQTHLTDSKLERERDLRLLGKAHGQISSDSQAGGQQLGGSNREQNSNFFQAQSPPFYHQRPGLFLPSRVGPDVLLYDRPFGVQQADGSGESPKLTYNYNHILGAGDSATVLTDERAKSLAHLERLRTLSRLYSRPDLVTPNELGTLLDYTQLRPLVSNVSNTIGHLDQANLSANSITKTSSSSHSERHHEHKSTSQLVDDLNRVTITREQKSGFSLGSGHDSRQSSGSEQGAGQAPPSQPTSEPPPAPQPPPQPQFSQQRWTPTARGQTLARLVAPYADEQQFATKGGVKGNGRAQDTTQQLADDANHQHQSTSTTPSLPRISPPDEPRAPTEPSSPDRDNRQQASSARPPPDEIELSLRMSGKTAAPQTQVVRSVRMPEDYRTSMLMNDLRSMQNALGLPQPPRLQRSSSPKGADGGDQQRFGGATNLAEQLVLARMARVDSLLRDGAASSAPASSTATQQQASVQQAVTVPASKPTARAHADESNKLDRINLLAALSQPNTSDNELDDDQPRRPAPSAKPSLKPADNLDAAQRGRQQSNETLALFEAQRLSNNRVKLRADKVSELEKFQQRLKTQQLLLEQVKSNENKTVQKQFKAGHVPSKPNEANSHVKYDEPQDSEPERAGALEAANQAMPSNGRNLRRSGEAEFVTSGRHAVETSASPVPEPTASKAHKESDYARQLQQWPSVSAGIERQRASGSNKSNETDAINSVDHSVKAHKMELPKLEERSQKQANSGNGTTSRSGPNTINLDFINSVTALSMDQLNPFAISSVNPAIQRASGAASSDRLSPHRLALPMASGQQQQLASNGGANLLATTPARYYSSSELLAALDHHERNDAGQRMRNLLGLNPSDSLNTPPTNHRQPGDTPFNLASSPYTTHPAHSPEPTAPSAARPFEALLGAKFIVSPAASSLAAAANSQHKSIVPTPRPTRELSMRSQTVGVTHRDGFEVRDRTIQADNHRFYEVVSSNRRQPNEMSSSFQAFRGESRR